MTDQDTDWAAGFSEPLRVKPGCTVRLPDDFDPGDRFGLQKKKDGARLLQRGAGLLTEYQRTPRQRNATRASQLTSPRADHAARTSTACSPRSAAQRNDPGPGS